MMGMRSSLVHQEVGAVAFLDVALVDRSGAAVLDDCCGNVQTLEEQEPSALWHC